MPSRCGARWPSARVRALSLALFAALHGCATVEVPLTPDAAYPRAWGAIARLGPQCKAVEGSYRNEGNLYNQSGELRPMQFTTLFEVPASAQVVSLNITARKVDRSGDAFVTLRIVPDGDVAQAQRREDCYCSSETLVCSRVGDRYLSLPKLEQGAAQANLYVALTEDGALVVKRLAYQVKMLLGSPVFDVTRSWARFEPPPR